MALAEYRDSEEVEYERNVGLLAQKTPLPRTRPGALEEPGAHWVDAALCPFSLLRC